MNKNDNENEFLNEITRIFVLIFFTFFLLRDHFHLQSALMVHSPHRIRSYIFVYVLDSTLAKVLLDYPCSVTSVFFTWWRHWLRSFRH